MIYGTLHLRLSDGQQQSHHLSQSSILLGRGLANDLLINDPSLAPAHARLTFQKGEVVLEDLGSANGTFISGVRIDPRKPYTLNRAEFIRFGSVDALLAPANSAPPAEWPAFTPPAPAPTAPPSATQPTFAVEEVQPPPAPKLVTIRINPKRSTRDFTVSLTRAADDPDSASQTILLAAADPTEDLAFTFKPQIIKIETGQTRTAHLEVRGLPGTFTVTAAGKGKSYTAATKAALISPDRSMQIVLVIALVLACVTGLFTLAACPTALRAVCGFIPANPISMAMSTATFTPSASPTVTPTLIPTLTASATPTDLAAPTFTPGGAVTENPATLATTPAPPPEYGGGLLTFKRQQADGKYSLIVVLSDGKPTTLIANKIDIRVLDYSSTNGLLALDTYDGVTHTLLLIRPDGAVVRDGINDGWDTIRNADFAPDGSFIIVDTLNSGVARYYFYSSDGTRLRDFVPLTPTHTPTFTRTPTRTLSPTITRTPSNTPTGSNTPTASRTATSTNTATATRTATSTNTATNTATPAPATATPAVSPTNTP